MNKPSRRAVVRTGVWAVPVVATASMAPAFAGSGTPPPVTIDSTGTACKFPGRSTDVPYGYRMTVTFENNSGVDQPIEIKSFDISGKTTTDINPTLFTVPGVQGQTVPTPKTFIVASSNSAQRYATITYVVAGQVVVQVVDFGSFPPCKCDPKDADASDPNSNCS
jgi:hypothetical protein